MPPPRRPALTSTPKRKRKRTAPQDDDGWWAIRGIVDEKVVRGKLQYLVDWEDNRKTGESYKPTWEPALNVTAQAIEEWNNKGVQNEAESSQASPGPDTQVEEGQPRCPADGRQFQHVNPNSTAEEDGYEDSRPYKRARLYTASPSLEPVPSITSSNASFDTTNEEPSVQWPPPQQKLAVELKGPPDFDPSEYHSVPTSQSTGNSTQSLSELESQDQRIAIASQEGTIPDSQDPSSLEFVQPHPAEIYPSSHLTAAPNSQEPSRTQSSSDKILSQSRGTPSPHQPSSGSQDQDIPSHQPNRQKAHTAESHDFSGGVSASVACPLSQDSSGEQRPVQAEPETVFFTQPNFPTPSNDSKGEPTNTGIPVSQDSAENNRNSAPVGAERLDLGASQAAQIIHRSYEVSDNELVESHGTTREPGNNSHNPVWAGPGSASAGRNNQDSLRESQSRGTTSPRQTASQALQPSWHPVGRGETHKVNMSSSGDGEYASPVQRVSAITQLQSLWDDNPSEARGSLPNTEGHSLASAELDVLGAESQGAHSQEPERPKQASYFTQPPHEAASWGASLESQTASGESPAPVSAMGRSQISAAESMQDLVKEAFGTPDEPPPESLMAHPHITEQTTVAPAEMSKPSETQPTTVAPTDVSKPVEADQTLALLPSFAGDEGIPSIYDSLEVPIPMGQRPQSHDTSSKSSDQETPMDYTVTLPFQANIRPLYNETLLRYKNAVTEFGTVFNSEIYEEPEASLVASIDELLGRLQNLCDYPEDLVGTSIEKMLPREKVTYALDANAKFNFIYELLQGIKTDTNVLIVARSTNLLRPLCELVDTLQLDYACSAIGSSDSSRNSAVHVTLALPDSSDPFLFEVVIGYDSYFNDSSMAVDLKRDESAKKKPLVLRLAAAYSVEHIDLEISDAPGPLERKNALLFGIVEARSLIEDPPQLPEPHEIAGFFVDYLNGETDTILWAPMPLPPQVLDAYVGSQSMSQMPDASLDPDNGRKRKLDDDGDAETKRMRRFSRVGPISEVNAPPLSTDVQALLERAGFKGGNGASNEAQLNVPLSVLENLAVNMVEAERTAEANNLEVESQKMIERLSKQVTEYESSWEGMYEKHRMALQDRTQFEKQAQKAEQALQAQIEENQKAEEERDAKLAELEATVTRLTTDSATEKLLQETQEKVRVLEKRLETSHNNEEYARKLYQDATSSTTATRAAYDELKERSNELEKKASDNLRSIHEIWKKNTAKEYLNLISELRTQLSERESELDRVREELRQAKNGRRETRVSVPRSPRMGLMSPRPPRGPAGVGGSASRGASPAPAMGGFDVLGPSTTVPFTPQQGGNGRWGHLRE